MEIIIRRATKQDIPALIRLDVQTTDYHAKLDPKALKTGRELRSVFKKFFLKQLARRNGRIFVATEGAKTIGFLMCEIQKMKIVYRFPKVGFISTVYVEGKARRSGAGAALLEEAIRWLKSKGMNRLELGIMCNNDIGMEFWTKQGFKPWWVKMWKKI